ncbi:aldose 1-epimerase family protein [Nicoliella spurrieriana]|uniref:Aldose 1-epimerase family protein n=1 Tax=Nicoliella spurrieriana TaxID=2925830 RepID=A0A976X5E6_9LACO|nr:aldose 1-epimerase family protein [Nicoliella spurrieriana]UQS86579.1 aldose 1-epimerase family protein [Nicoliella spurrieriana]
MEFTLLNDDLTIKVNSKGAELNSVKGANGIEYLWQAEPNFWCRHAPILFPIVGRLKNDKYEYEGKQYSMGQHGFARDMEFKLSEQTNDSITMVLNSDSDTKAMYPFDFQLFVKYTLEQKTLKVNLTVVNSDDKTMYFSVGAHPAFNVPLTTGTFSDYQLNVIPNEIFDQVPLQNSLSNAKSGNEIDLKSPLGISRTLFKNDAVILNLNSNPVEIKLTNAHNSDDHGVSLQTKDAEYMGLWSQYPQDAQFVCIEPWWGIADDVDTDGLLIHKKGIKDLAAGARFNTQFDITVH